MNTSKRIDKGCEIIYLHEEMSEVTPDNPSEIMRDILHGFHKDGQTVEDLENWMSHAIAEFKKAA